MSSLSPKIETQTFKKSRLLQKLHCFLFRWCFFRSQAKSPTGKVGTKSQIWRKKNEVLQFTAKGSKVLAGGPRLHLIVAITYGIGVVLKEVYEKMDRVFRAVYSDTFEDRLCAIWTRQRLFRRQGSLRGSSGH